MVEKPRGTPPWNPPPRRPPLWTPPIKSIYNRYFPMVKELAHV